MLETNHAYIALNLISGIGPLRVKQLLSHFETPQNILFASLKDLQTINGLGPKIASKIVNWQSEIDLEKELKLIEQSGVVAITQDSALYPRQLKEIYDPPLVLYFRGNINCLNKLQNSLAVVGTRNITRYGQSVCERIIGAATLNKWTTVSGMAVGIDTSAHRITLNNKGCTIGVLGSGLARFYPQQNIDLARETCENGAIISEFPMTFPPDRRSFPMRNRIISGLAQATIVIEAGKKSGSLITAGLALEQGKQVFAVPGPIDSPTSQGCHQLIKEGAKLVESFEDILEDFEFLPLFKCKAKLDQSEKKDFSSFVDTLQLTEVQQKILKFVIEGECSANEIAIHSELPLGKAFATLIEMETRKLLKPLPGKRYTLSDFARKQLH